MEDTEYMEFAPEANIDRFCEALKLLPPSEKTIVSIPVETYLSKLSGLMGLSSLEGDVDVSSEIVPVHEGLSALMFGLPGEVEFYAMDRFIKGGENAIGKRIYCTFRNMPASDICSFVEYGVNLKPTLWEEEFTRIAWHKSEWVSDDATLSLYLNNAAMNSSFVEKYSPVVEKLKEARCWINLINS